MLSAADGEDAPPIGDGLPVEISIHVWTAFVSRVRKCESKQFTMCCTLIFALRIHHRSHNFLRDLPTATVDYVMGIETYPKATHVFQFST